MKFRLVSRLYHLVFLLLIAGNLFAQVPARPQPQKLVNDLSGLFSSRQVQVMEKALVDFADSTSNQIVVVTLPELYGYDKAELAYEIGQQWGVGQKEFDNGLVILIKPKTADSSGEVFIATGYGLEGAVTDAFAKMVIEREMIPHFRQDDYYGGTVAALKVLMPVISGEISVDKYAASDEEGLLPSALFLLFMGIVVYALFVSSDGNNQNMGGGNNRGSRNFTATDAFILGSVLGNSSGRRSGGSFGGGSFGGGFGGFGGGSFGGGGAGGSW